MTPDQILQLLRQIPDPQTGTDIISANMVEQLRVDGNNVSFTLVLPHLQAQYKSSLNFACIEVINQAYPTAQVHIHLMARTPQAGQVNTPLPQVKNIIAVASGKGGVGKSTVAVNLALGLHALGARVGLMDADLYGPSIPTMLGLQGKRPQVRQLYGQHKIVPLEAHGIQTISIGFIIEPEQAVVLRGPRLGAIMKQFFNDCLWAELDYLIIDLPPGTGDIQLTLVQTAPVTGAIIVTTPQEVAVVDAVKAMNMFMLDNINVPILGVVENMSWFTPAELPNHRYYLFGEGGGKRLAQLANTVLLGQIPLIQGIREAGDAGKPAVITDSPILHRTFTELARKVAAQVAIRHQMLGPTRIVSTQQ